MSLLSQTFLDRVERVEETEVVVVGGGIVGTTIGKTLRRMGQDVVILDDERERDGTRPCGGSIKPSPLTGLKKEEEYIPLLRLLEDLYGLDQERFEIRPSGGFVKATVHQVRMYNVWKVKRRKATVVGLLSGPSVLLREKDRIVKLKAHSVVVATGAWVGDLLPHVFPPGTIQTKQGVSFLFDHKTTQAFVSCWAPYKQVTVHPFHLAPDREVTWGSDGTAILIRNWKPTQTNMCLQRIQKQIHADPPFEIRHGFRPYHRAKHRPCFLKEVSDHIWATTGGGKFGCVAAAWAALRLREILG